MVKLYAAGFFLMASVAGAQTSLNACSPDPVIGDALEKAMAASIDPTLPYTARIAPFRELLERYPPDPFVNRAWLAHFGGYNLRPLYDGEIGRYAALHGAHPESAAARYLFALAMQYRDPVKSKEMLEAVVAEQTKAPWPHLALVFLYAHIQPFDPDRALEHLRQVTQLCPDSLDTGVLKSIAADGDQSLKKATVERLRKQLAGRAESAALRAWPVLWEIEFQITPAAGHEELRARIRQDVAALRGIPSKTEDRKLDVMRQGSTLANDLQSRRGIAAELARVAPRSAAAAEAAIELWQEQNPSPDRSAPWNEITAYQKKWTAAAQEWIDRWPNYGPAWNGIVAMVRSDAPDHERMTALGRRAADFLVKNPDATLGFTDQPVLELAAAMARAGVNLDLVPELLARGEKQSQARLASDRSAQVRPLGDVEVARNFQSEGWLVRSVQAVLQARSGDSKGSRESLQALLTEAFAQKDTILAWRGLAAVAEAALPVGDSTSAREAIVRMSAVLGGEATNTAAETQMHAIHEAGYWQMRARLAALEGRDADAAAFYIRATKATPRNFNPAGRSRLAALAEEAWRKLGGTPEGWQAYNPDTIAGKSDAQWKEVGRTMPAFTLEDMSGQPVRSTDVRGKTVFINVWATWCGPCQGELPWVQKLYEAMKESRDVAILTFNVDENPGAVAPYLREHGFHFPVVLAKEYVDNTMKVEAIPRNWIVDSAGVLRWERQAGFDETFVRDSIAAIARAK